MEINLTNLNYKVIKRPIGWVRRSRKGSVKFIEINNEIFVLKQYGTHPSCKDNYRNEKQIYTILRNETFLPKLKYYNDKEQLLILEDVGISIDIYNDISKYNNLLENFNNQLKGIIDILYYKYSLCHKDIRPKNICISNNIIRLIDFELCEKISTETEINYHQLEPKK